MPLDFVYPSTKLSKMYSRLEIPKLFIDFKNKK